MENKKYNFRNSAEGFIFVVGILIIVAGYFYFFFTGFTDWSKLVGMIFAGIFLGKVASIPIALGFLKDRIFTAIIISLQDVVTIFIILLLVMFVKNKVIKSKFISGFLDKGDQLAKDYRFIKVLGIVGVGIVVWIPLHPITGPIMGTVLGTILGLSFFINLITTITAATVSAFFWTFLYGLMFKWVKDKNTIFLATAVIILLIMMSAKIFFSRTKGGDTKTIKLREKVL